MWYNYERIFSWRKINRKYINVDNIKVDEEIYEFLKDNGFMNLTSCFYLKRKLYENKITLTVTIEKETKEVLVEVYDEILKHVYTPFYNREYNQNNQVLDEVLKKYKSIIKDLENKKILTIE